MIKQKKIGFENKVEETQYKTCLAITGTIKMQNCDKRHYHRVIYDKVSLPKSK